MKHVHLNWRLSDEIYLPVSTFGQQHSIWLRSVTHIEIGVFVIKPTPDIINLCMQGAGMVNLS